MYGSHTHVSNKLLYITLHALIYHLHVLVHHSLHLVKLWCSICFYKDFKYYVVFQVLSSVTVYRTIGVYHQQDGSLYGTSDVFLSHQQGRRLL